MNFSEIYPQIAQVAMSYNYKKPPDLLVKIQEWIEKALRWLSDWLNSIQIKVPGLTDSRMASTVLQVILWLIGVVCLILLLVALWNHLKQLKLQTQLARKGQTISGQLLNASAWRSEGERLAAGGNFKEACRASYFSALRLLDEEKIVEFSPTRTNYEYWYALAKTKKLAQNFRALAYLVEMVWFGNRQADKADYEESMSLLKLIESEAEAHTATEQATISGAT
jgi:Domain of unknown function (DUF4129)